MYLIMRFKSPENFHNKLSFIFHALLAPPLIGFIYLFLEIKNNSLTPAITNGRENYVIISAFLAIAICLAGIGFYLFRKNNSRIDKNDAMSNKLNLYYVNSIVFFGMLEGSSLLVVCGLLLTTSTFFVVAYMIVLLLLSLNRPTPQKYVRDLPLTNEEREVILHKRPFPDEN